MLPKQKSPEQRGVENTFDATKRDSGKANHVPTYSSSKSINTQGFCFFFFSY